LVSIAPEGRWPRIDLRELWSYRGLFYFLVRRDVKARYAQTVMGAAWAVLQPILSMVVFTVIFGRFARVPSEGLPYAVFSLTALVPWYYFSTALTWSSNSLLGNVQLITKVYFPRLIMPFSAVLASLTDFAVSFVVLLSTLLAFGFVPLPEAVVVVPLLTLVMMATAAGVGFILAALNVQYRDVKQAVPFFVQVWMFASPIVYPISMVPENYRPLYALNPLAGVIAGFRTVLLRTGPVPWREIGISIGVSLCLFVAGALYFRRSERIFADVA
jgi:lipopolysaccharide transport system permease protein